MSAPKTKDNQQWGRVSTTGTTPGNVSVDDDGREPLVDEFGRLWVRDGGGIIPPFDLRNQFSVSSTPGNIGKIIVGAPNFLVSITGFVQSSVSPFPLFFQLFDLAGLPPVTPFISIPLLAINTAFSYSVGFESIVGLVVGLSTTPTTYTAAAAGDVFAVQGVLLT